jgi:hypothetical protein
VTHKQAIKQGKKSGERQQHPFSASWFNPARPGGLSLPQALWAMVLVSHWDDKYRLMNNIHRLYHHHRGPQPYCRAPHLVVRVVSMLQKPVLPFWRKHLWQELPQLRE